MQIFESSFRHEDEDPVDVASDALPLFCEDSSGAGGPAAPGPETSLEPALPLDTLARPHPGAPRT